jgi:hypothetical protein
MAFAVSPVAAGGVVDSSWLTPVPGSGTTQQLDHRRADGGFRRRP